jgi:hypothetical protein
MGSRGYGKDRARSDAFDAAMPYETKSDQSMIPGKIAFSGKYRYTSGVPGGQSGAADVLA